MNTILVTGAGGQLGQCFRQEAENVTDLKFIFKTSSELSITSKEQLDAFFSENTTIDYIINCAAYTNVDKAETEPKKAYEINVNGIKNLAEVCLKHNITLIHFSTDYVFDGTKNMPYTEDDEPNPINQYGKTKLEGDEAIMKLLKKYFIFRVSWLYSEFGSNFYKTIQRLAKEKDEISVVNDQLGCPTRGEDVAKAVVELIKNKNTNYGLYNFCGNKVMSWYDFAKAIVKEHKLSVKITKTTSLAFKTLAKRPMYSVLNVVKIQRLMEL